MLIIFGLIVLLFAVIVGVAGVLNNAGAAHALTEDFSVFGYHVIGSTGTLFLFGIAVGAVALLGLSVLLAGARRSATRGRYARRELARSQREAEFSNRDRDTRLEHSQRADAPAGATGRSDVHSPGRRRNLLGRWSRNRRPVGANHVDEVD